MEILASIHRIATEKLLVVGADGDMVLCKGPSASRSGIVFGEICNRKTK